MNLFEIVKYGVSCREAAERYGVEVNHYGMALCPFHNDRHPSLYVADDHYYGEKYDPMMMQDSKRDVANLLNEETEARSIRERLRQKQQAQQKQNKKKSRDRWER